MDLINRDANESTPAINDVDMAEHTTIEEPSPEQATAVKQEPLSTTFDSNSKENPIDLDNYVSPTSFMRGPGTSKADAFVIDDSDEDYINLNSQSPKRGGGFNFRNGRYFIPDRNEPNPVVKKEATPIIDDDFKPPKFRVLPEIDDFEFKNAEGTSPEENIQSNETDDDSLFVPPQNDDLSSENLETPIHKEQKLKQEEVRRYNSPEKNMLNQPEAEENVLKPSAIPKNGSSNNDKKRKRYVPSSLNIVNKRPNKKQSKGEAEGETLELFQALMQSNVSEMKSYAQNEKPLQYEAETIKDFFRPLLENLPEGADPEEAEQNERSVRAAVRLLRRHISVEPSNASWTVGDMKNPLFNHQVIGAGWMIKRERNQDPLLPSGGICADEMGLGKTVEILAVIVANPRYPKKPRKRKDPEVFTVAKEPKATLVVVPKPVKSQWLDEIHKHSNLAALPYQTTGMTLAQQKVIYPNQDIVVATWDEITKSMPYPDQETLDRLRREGKSQKFHGDSEIPLEEWIAGHPEEGKALHQIDWYRVVLDESHYMKNRKSLRSLAAFALKGKYRWSMSGTVIMNGIFELYSQFRFLRHPSSAEGRAVFEANHKDWNDAASRKRLIELRGNYIIRREIKTKLFGRPIIDLPEKNVEVEDIKLCRDVRVIYRIFEKRLREKVNAQLDPKNPFKTLKNVRTRVLRLRQFISQPLSVEEEILHALKLKDLQEIKKQFKKLKRRRELGKGWMQRVEGWIKEKMTKNDRVEEMGNDGVLCSECEDFAEDPYVINVRRCQHVFCKLCIDTKIHEQEDADHDGTRCPLEDCQVKFDYDKQLKPWSSKGPDPGTSDFRKGRDALGLHPKVKKSCKWMEDYDKDKVTLSVAMGGKMKNAQKKLKTWLGEAPEEKFIVFAQFHTSLATVGRILEIQGVKFVYFMGTMNAGARTEAIEKFQSDPQIKVMISSLQCGGVGLNLAFASRAIIVDLWWNASVEKQAFGRVHRFPQDKPTFLYRPIVQDSIDCRLNELQRNKEAQISPTMKPTANVIELADLIGESVQDENGNLVRIDGYEYENESDDEEDDEGYNEGENWIDEDDENLYDA